MMSWWHMEAWMRQKLEKTENIDWDQAPGKTEYYSENQNREKRKAENQNISKLIFLSMLVNLYKSFQSDQICQTHVSAYAIPFSPVSVL